MGNDVYKKLAKHLDKLPGGFPATESGVELRILKHLFTPKEAELAVHLSLIPEEPRVLARRFGMSVEDTARQLESMAKKGLIYRIRANGKSTYMAAQFVVGIWEYHVNDLSPELVRDMNEYIPTLLEDAWKRPQLRTIPVGTSLNNDLKIMTYEKAEELVSQRKKAVVAPCICRREKKITEDACDRPEETCLVFGMAADYYQTNGLGREIDQKEALDILKMADEAGLVLQPSNAQKIVNICCCCGCCCGILRTIRTYPNPAQLCASPFIVSFDVESCKGCGICVKRCQMDALTLVPGEGKKKKAALNPDRCIGCGLCVSKCPTNSLVLKRKPEEEQPPVPSNMVSAAIQHGRARGKLGTMDMAWMQIKSKVDRMLALKK